jgi:chemotaxis protein MotB
MTSFADMMTLLLTFFILLVAFAEEQRAELVAAGTGSFVNAIETLGLPGLLPGGRRPIDKGALCPHFIIPPRHVERAPDGRPLNAELLTAPNDRMRRATIDYLRQKHSVGLSTPVAFRPATAELIPRSLESLDALGELAQQSLSYVTIEAHVSGPGDGWALSALRAAAVARRLHARAGIAYERMTLAGHGRFHPIAEAGSAPGEANDRIRVLLSPKPPKWRTRRIDHARRTRS